MNSPEERGERAKAVLNGTSTTSVASVTLARDLLTTLDELFALRKVATDCGAKNKGMLLEGEIQGGPVESGVTGGFESRNSRSPSTSFPLRERKP